MRRTLQTALRSLDFLIAQGVPIQAHAGWQENSAKPCDTGSSISALQAEFPEVDFSKVDPVYPDKTSPAGAAYAYNRRAIVERGERCLKELRGRGERAVVVVSHSGFMRQGVTGWWYFNADYRVFEFEEGEGVGLRQWESTIKGGLGRSREERVVIGERIPEEDEVLPDGEGKGPGAGAAAGAGTGVGAKMGVA